MSDENGSQYMVKVKSTEYNIWEKKKPLLSSLQVELTERCNNNCIHCYINLAADSPKKKLELSTAEIKNVLDEAASLGCMEVVYTGGEPLLREDFEELYIHARKLGMRVTIRTNGTLLTAHLAELFTRIPPLEPIVITVYGMTRSTYDAVTRTPGSFDAFRRGIDLLTEHHVPFKLISMLIPINLKDSDSFEAWLAQLPCEDKSPSYNDLLLDLRARRESDKNNVIRHIRFSPEQALAIQNRMGGDKSEMREFCAKFMGLAGNTLFNCGAGLGVKISLDAYGNLQPCLQLRHPDAIYDLKNGSIKDALTEFFPGLRGMKTENPAYLARCARCFLKGLCEQCPGKSWMEHGTLDTPVDYLCEFAHLQAQDLGLLEKGEKAWEVEDWKERVNNLSSNT
jgi:radical SAM protein with 4Fe4S-binding SPASM domain